VLPKPQTLCQSMEKPFARVSCSAICQQVWPAVNELMGSCSATLLEFSQKSDLQQAEAVVSQDLVTEVQLVDGREVQLATGLPKAVAQLADGHQQLATCCQTCCQTCWVTGND